MSESIPRPESLVERTVEVLRERIGEGRYGDTLPGEPRLASQLAVSRGTLRNALDALAGKGWISASIAGKPRRVLLTSGASKAQEKRSVGILIPRPLDALSIATQHFLRDLAAATAPEGISFVHHSSEATHRSRPERLLKALLAEHPADLWLLYEASKPMARFFHTTGTPAIVCGGAALDEGLSFCGFDGAAALRHAIGTFSRAGHSRIVAATRYQRPLRERIFREEFAKRGLSFDLQTNMPCWNSDPDQLHDLLRTRLSAPGSPHRLDRQRTGRPGGPVLHPHGTRPPDPRRRQRPHHRLRSDAEVLPARHQPLLHPPPHPGSRDGAHDPRPSPIPTTHPGPETPPDRIRARWIGRPCPVSEGQ